MGWKNINKFFNHKTGPSMNPNYPQYLEFDPFMIPRHVTQIIIQSNPRDREKLI